MKNDPENIEAMTQMGIINLFDYNDKKARDYLTRALEHKNTYIPALFAMGELNRFTGQFPEAI